MGLRIPGQVTLKPYLRVQSVGHDVMLGIGIAISIAIALVGALIFWVVSIFQSDMQSAWITDQSILKLIWELPDRIVCKDDLANRYGISKSLAARRLLRLHSAGVLRSFMATSTKSYYEIRNEKDLHFESSSKTQLDLDILLGLFQANEFRLSYARIIASTGFSLREVKRAIRFFKKEKVVMTVSDMITHKQTILLKEPYRSNASNFAESAKIEDPISVLDLSELSAIMASRKEISSMELTTLKKLTLHEATAALDDLVEKNLLVVENDPNGNKRYLLR